MTALQSIQASPWNPRRIRNTRVSYDARDLSRMHTVVPVLQNPSDFLGDNWKPTQLSARTVDSITDSYTGTGLTWFLLSSYMTGFQFNHPTHVAVTLPAGGDRYIGFATGGDDISDRIVFDTADGTYWSGGSTGISWDSINRVLQWDWASPHSYSFIVSTAKSDAFNGRYYVPSPTVRLTAKATDITITQAPSVLWSLDACGSTQSAQVASPDDLTDPSWSVYPPYNCTLTEHEIVATPFTGDFLGIYLRVVGLQAGVSSELYFETKHGGVNYLTIWLEDGYLYLDTRDGTYVNDALYPSGATVSVTNLGGGVFGWTLNFITEDSWFYIYGTQTAVYATAWKWTAVGGEKLELRHVELVLFEPNVRRMASNDGYAPECAAGPRGQNELRFYNSSVRPATWIINTAHTDAVGLGTTVTLLLCGKMTDGTKGTMVDSWASDGVTGFQTRFQRMAGSTMRMSSSGVGFDVTGLSPEQRHAWALEFTSGGLGKVRCDGVLVGQGMLGAMSAEDFCLSHTADSNYADVDRWDLHLGFFQVVDGAMTDEEHANFADWTLDTGLREPPFALCDSLRVTDTVVAVKS